MAKCYTMFVLAFVGKCERPQCPTPNHPIRVHLDVGCTLEIVWPRDHIQSGFWTFGFETGVESNRFVNSATPHDKFLFSSTMKRKNLQLAHCLYFALQRFFRVWNVYATEFNSLGIRENFYLGITLEHTEKNAIHRTLICRGRRNRPESKSYFTEEDSTYTTMLI